jgi:hypothetical protein
MTSDKRRELLYKLVLPLSAVLNPDGPIRVRIRFFEL